MEDFKPVNPLILVRHGDYHQSSGKLSESGKITISNLLPKLALFITDPVIFTSPKLRAWQSAEIFIHTYNPEFRILSLLDYEKFDQEDQGPLFHNIFGLHKRKKDLILITHLPVVEKILKQLTGKEVDSNRLETGTAVIIDHLTKRAVIVHGHYELEIE